jgi:tetrahydromethanopterin S-methyltransferase subunit G
MYTHSERALSEAEREQLDNQLRQANEDFAELAMKTVALALVAGLSLFAAVMAVLGRDRSGPMGILCGAIVGVTAHLLLIYHVVAFVSTRRERRRLREALADRAAVVEHVEAAAGICLQHRGGAWHLLQVGEQQLFALPNQHAGLMLTEWLGFQPDWRLAACFELISTRRHRLPLGLIPHGQSTLLLTPIQLDSLIDDPRRRQVVARLDAVACFPGRLTDLPEALRRLLEQEPLAAEAGGKPITWGHVQAEIEEQFSLDFGPGGLEAEMARLAQDRSPVARDLLDLVQRRLPAGALYSVRPLHGTFLRLRTALAEECGAAPESIQPSTRLEDVIPRREREAVWERLAQRLGQPLPPFAERDTPLAVGVVAGLGVLLVYAVGIPAIQAIDAFALDHGFAAAWWFFALGACLVPTSFVAGIGLSVLLAMWLFRNRYPPSFRADCRTVSDLTRFLAATVEEVTIPWTEEAAWQALRGILARAAWRDPLELTHQTRLIEEWGLPGAKSPAGSA